MAENEKNVENTQKPIIVTNSGVYDLVDYEFDKTVPEYGKAYRLKEYPGIFLLYRPDGFCFSA